MYRLRGCPSVVDRGPDKEKGPFRMDIMKRGHDLGALTKKDEGVVYVGGRESIENLVSVWVPFQLVNAFLSPIGRCVGVRVDG